MAATDDSGQLSEFAESAALKAGTGGYLPRTGTLLSRGDLKVSSAANGPLPGGRTGTICHLTYTTRSDDTTTTHRRTAVIVRVPESIGYAPYLRIGSAFGLVNPMGDGIVNITPDPGVRIAANEGVDRGWLTELFSPAFGEWLGRSPRDFGAELADGVLVVVRDGHLTDEADLTNLCTDATRIADALRDESLEEADSGGGSVATSARATREEVLASGLLPRLGLEHPPEHVAAARAEAQELAVHSPRTWALALRSTLLWMLGINVIGGGIYGLLLNLPSPLLVVGLYQLFLLVLVGTLVFRSKSSKVAARISEVAFYEGYAKERGLRSLEPLRFAAEHAEANLPGRPVRAFEGLFGGTAGTLMLTGEGRIRGDQIALVRGPKGPTATVDLNVSAPGMSTKALDACVETLLLDLETAPPAATPSARAAPPG